MVPEPVEGWSLSLTKGTPAGLYAAHGPVVPEPVEGWSLSLSKGTPAGLYAAHGPAPPPGP